jgi:hypothetical protein
MSSDGGAPLRHEGRWLVGISLGAGLLAGLGWALVQYLALVERIATMAPYYDQNHRINLAVAAYQQAHPGPLIVATAGIPMYVPDPITVRTEDSLLQVVAAGVVLGTCVAALCAVAGFAVRRRRTGWAAVGLTLGLAGGGLAMASPRLGGVALATTGDALSLPTIITPAGPDDANVFAYGWGPYPPAFLDRFGVDPATLVQIPLAESRPWWLVAMTWGLATGLIGLAVALLWRLPGRSQPYRSGAHLRRHEAAIALVAAVVALAWWAWQDGLVEAADQFLAPMGALLLVVGVAVMLVAAGSATRRVAVLVAVGLCCAVPVVAAVIAAVLTTPGGVDIASPDGPLPAGIGWPEVLVVLLGAFFVGALVASWGRGPGETRRTLRDQWHRRFGHGPELHLHPRTRPI